MKITINDIARLTGVSNATVSHVINNTRYVSPEIKKRVWDKIEETGYGEKLRKKNGLLRIDSGGCVAMVVPDISSITYSRFSLKLAEACEAEGFTFCTFFSFGNVYREKVILNSLASNRGIRGIILIPSARDAGFYEEISSQTPMVFLDKGVGSRQIPSITADNAGAIYQAARHLIRIGHEKIGLLIQTPVSSVGEKSMEGYKNALDQYKVSFSDEMIIPIADESEFDAAIERCMGDWCRPTAVIATTNHLTQRMLHYMNRNGLVCPRDISFVGFGDNEWSALAKPAITNLRHDFDRMVQKTLGALKGQMDPSKKAEGEGSLSVSMEFSVYQSTQAICRGPFGEKALSPEALLLSEEEQSQLREHHFRVAISFQDTTNSWYYLHEQAIRETLNSYGVSIIAVMDAQHDYELQITQLDSLLMQKPDAIITLPVDEEKTANKYKEISTETRLIFLNGLPARLGPDHYYGWVSVNDWENGKIAAEIIIDYFRGHSSVNVGLLTHGISFLGSHQREFCVEQLLEDAGNITISGRKSFMKTEQAYEACREIMEQDPTIQCLYITYSRAAEHAIKALEELGRDDVVIVTTDLTKNIAKYMAEKRFVVGLSSQQFYKQGVALANATAKALLGHVEHKNICVQPYKVLPENLREAWQDIMKSRIPDFLT